MKTLEEKRLLIKMAKMFGQPIDPALVESIEREERLAATLFGKSKETIEERIPILKEDKAETAPPSPAPAFTPPIPDTVQQTVNILNTAVTANQQVAVSAPSSQREFDALKRQIGEIMQKMSTLSWGGGGTGIVRLENADDFVRDSRTDEKKFMTFRDGYFTMDYINPKEIVANTVYVTSNTYHVTNDDYYIGINTASTVMITLPPSDDVFTGREFYIKDESGNAGAPKRYIDIYPSGSDKIDGQDYVRLQIDHGGLKFIYHNGWRVI